MTYAETCSAVRCKRSPRPFSIELTTELPNRHKGIPQQIVRDALQEAFNRGVSAGVDAERLVIRNALTDYFDRRDAVHRAGGLVNPDDRSDGSDTPHQLQLKDRAP